MLTSSLFFQNNPRTVHSSNFQTIIARNIELQVFRQLCNLDFTNVNYLKFTKQLKAQQQKEKKRNRMFT